MAFASPPQLQRALPAAQRVLKPPRWRPAVAAGALGLLLALAGAHAAYASAQAAADTTAPGKIGAKAEQALAHGKAGTSGVTFRYEVPEKIAVGEAVTMHLHFGGIRAVEGANVEVRDPSTQLTLLSLHLPAGQAKSVSMVHVARTDGLQYLDVVTTQGGRSSVRSIPLRVGSGPIKLKTEGQRRSTAAGESVISLPSSR